MSGMPPDSTLTLTTELENASAAEIIVSDNGAGISEANLTQVFDAFFTTARETGGSGLG